MEINMQYVCNEPFWKFKKLDGSESYCKVCKKNIVDFRDYSSDELAAYKALNTEASCGIFTSEQAGVHADTVYGASVYKIVLASLVSVFTFSISDSKAQAVVDSVEMKQYPVVKSDTVVETSPKEVAIKEPPKEDSRRYSKRFYKKKQFLELEVLKWLPGFLFLEKKDVG